MIEVRRYAAMKIHTNATTPQQLLTDGLGEIGDCEEVGRVGIEPTTIGLKDR